MVLIKVRQEIDREGLFLARHEFEFYPNKLSAQAFVDIVRKTRQDGYCDREIEEVMDMKLDTFDKMMDEAESLSEIPSHGERLIEQTV